VTTLATRDFLSDIAKGNSIPRANLGYFEARLSGLIHQALLQLFGKLERQNPPGEVKTLTRRDLARRIGRRPEQITRWLSYPGNLTVETVSDLFVGMGYELESVVLANLITGEKVSFAHKLYGPMEAAWTKGERSQAAADTYFGDPQFYKDSAREIPRTALSQAVGGLVPGRSGQAAADQLNVQGSYAAIRDLAA
jgi:hypothetical protein